MGSLSLLQGIFPTQGSNWGLPHCRRTLYQLSHKGSLEGESEHNQRPDSELFGCSFFLFLLWGFFSVIFPFESMVRGNTFALRLSGPTCALLRSFIACCADAAGKLAADAVHAKDARRNLTQKAEERADASLQHGLFPVLPGTSSGVNSRV